MGSGARRTCVPAQALRAGHPFRALRAGHVICLARAMTNVTPARSDDDGSWPRGLQIFALLTFAVNAAVVLFLVR